MFSSLHDSTTDHTSKRLSSDNALPIAKRHKDRTKINSLNNSVTESMTSKKITSYKLTSKSSFSWDWRTDSDSEEANPGRKPGQTAHSHYQRAIGGDTEEISSEPIEKDVVKNLKDKYGKHPKKPPNILEGLNKLSKMGKEDYYRR